MDFFADFLTAFFATFLVDFFAAFFEILKWKERVYETLLEMHRSGVEPWRVTLVDTGEQTMTGGRLKRVRDYVGEGTFCMTYGDGLSDLNINDLIAFHRGHRALATLTAVQPPGRFGAFTLEPDQTYIDQFREKPRGDHDSAWVNGGFFVLESGVFDYIDGDAAVWEAEPLENLARDGKLAAYRYEGFWQPMDTLRDKMLLEEFWQTGHAPWKRW
jgi:glucose-1-phosphate cytidylyltransferase